MSDRSGGSRMGFIGWFWLGVVGLGAVATAVDWVAENRETVDRIKFFVWLVAVLGLVGLVWREWAKRSGRVRRGLSGGWGPGDRVVFAVAPAADSGRRRGPGVGLGQQRRKVSPEVEYWLEVLHRAGGLSGGVVRVLWVRRDGRWVFGVSVPREIGPSAQRSAGAAWPDARVGEWPADGGGEVSDSVPVEEVGGGTVVRCYLAPEVGSRPLNRPSTTLDHPLASVLDVLEGHRDVDVELRIDVVALSATERERVCSERLGELDEWDPDREMWETDERRGLVAGVRLLLRVSRAGPGHASECEGVADQICRVLGSFWATDHNRLVSRKVSDAVFDQIWESGVLERDVPVWPWESLEALLGPPPAAIGRTAEARRLPDPPRWGRSIRMFWDDDAGRGGV